MSNIVNQGRCYGFWLYICLIFMEVFYADSDKDKGFNKGRVA